MSYAPVHNLKNLKVMGTTDLQSDAVFRGNFYHANATTETVSDAAETVAFASDCGKIFLCDTADTVITLPVITAASSGFQIKIVNNESRPDQISVTVTAGAGDLIKGAGLTTGAAGSIINTQTTSERGDYVIINSNGVVGGIWNIVEIGGTWAVV